jgi:hypothetical protein
MPKEYPKEAGFSSKRGEYATYVTIFDGMFGDFWRFLGDSLEVRQAARGGEMRLTSER